MKRIFACFAVFSLGLAWALPIQAAALILGVLAAAACVWLCARTKWSNPVWLPMSAGAMVLMLPAVALAAESGPSGISLLGVPLLTLGLGVLGGGYLALKFIAPKTEAKWDDQILDVVEGAADTLGVDPEELAKKSAGRLKKKLIK